MKRGATGRLNLRDTASDLDLLIGGASGNVAMVEMCTRLAIERARKVTLHLQQARRSSIPTTRNWHTLQGKELRVAKKRAIGRYPKAFRKMAVERLKSCDNIVALAEELGVHRRMLYKWRDQLEPVEDGEGGEPANLRERELRRQASV